jgi:hypothetical protein
MAARRRAAGAGRQGLFRFPRRYHNRQPAASDSPRQHAWSPGKVRGKLIRKEGGSNVALAAAGMGNYSRTQDEGCEDGGLTGSNGGDDWHGGGATFAVGAVMLKSPVPATALAAALALALSLPAAHRTGPTRSRRLGPMAARRRRAGRQERRRPGLRRCPLKMLQRAASRERGSVPVGIITPRPAVDR